MKRTLILAVDRDDDFGVKAGVETPVIGVEEVMVAAMKLGAADPEDSDVNSVFSAIRIHDELFAEGKDVQVALICGDKKVGHKSDAAIIDELEAVIDTVQPDRVILVSDGSEDEYVYPIISSRVPIDSVKKVFVKQAPGLEGSLYIISRMLRDNDKRRRFLAPMGWMLIIISMIFMIPDFLRYLSDGNSEVILGMTGTFFIFFIGVVFCIYAYNIMDHIRLQYDRMMKDVKSGNLSIVFNVLAIALLISGIVVGTLAVTNMYESSFVYKALTFASNVLWLAIFALICAGFGKFIDAYMKTRTFNRSFMIGSLTALALAFVIQGIIDMMCAAFGFAFAGEVVVIYEFMLGIGFGMCAAILQMSFKELFDSIKTEEEEDPDAVL